MNAFSSLGKAACLLLLTPALAAAQTAADAAFSGAKG